MGHKIRVEIRAVIEVDSDEWANVDLYEHLGEEPSTDPDVIAGQVRGMWGIEDELPRWARDAVRVVEES